jgi:hypothetical protein
MSSAVAVAVMAVAVWELLTVFLCHVLRLVFAPWHPKAHPPEPR